MTRFFIAASFATVAALFTGWAHANADKPRCAFTALADGSQLVVCKRAPLALLEGA